MNEKSEQFDHSERVFVCAKHRSSREKNQGTSMGDSKNKIIGPNGSLDKYGIPKLKIALNMVIECPGCSLFLPREELCAGHLLSECLRPKNRSDDEALRTRFTQWLTKYFYAHFTKSTKNNTRSLKPPEAKKRKYAEGGFVRVELGRIPFGLQCPVCQKYFVTQEKCFGHLFETCLRTSNAENALSALKWFSHYLRTNSKSKLDLVTDPNLFQDTNKRCVCNYCKKEFYNRECMLNHFRQSHERVESKDAICSLCNFKPGSEAQLFRHLIKMHVKCGCLERHKDFNSLKMHLSGCPKNEGCVCPTCRDVEIRSYETESEFERHILNCRKPVPLKLNLRDLYKECDICRQPVLKCNIDTHVVEHLKASDTARRQPTNTFVKFSDLQDMLSETDALKMKKLFE